jgi:hypothetical protein
MSSTVEEENIVLKRKLSETEARISARFLLSAEQTLSSSDYTKLCAKFKENESLDLLEMERSIADTAKQLSNILLNLYEAVKQFKLAKKDMDAIEQGSTEMSENPQEVYDRMMRAREKMFSLVEEYQTQFRFAQ